MSALQRLAVRLEGFSSEAHYSGVGLTLTLKGNADLRVRATLGQVLQQVHEEALRLRLREVVLDMQQLEFMNSSCFKSFVVWLSSLEALPKQMQYRVRVQSNPSAHWQRRSLHALRAFATELVDIH